MYVPSDLAIPLLVSILDKHSNVVHSILDCDRKKKKLEST